MVDFLTDDLIAIHTNPYYGVANRKVFLFNIHDAKVYDTVEFEDSIRSAFIPGPKGKIYYYYELSDTSELSFGFDISTKQSYPITDSEYMEYLSIRKYKDYKALEGNMDFIWGLGALNPWHNIRLGSGLDLDTGSERFLGMFNEGNYLFSFPYVRIAENGFFETSPDGHYLGIETGFYRNDVFRDNPPPYESEYQNQVNFSGSVNDTYQYCVFIYELVTPENIDILSDPTVELITFPNPNEIAKGNLEIRTHRFDGTHMHVWPNEDPIWGTTIFVDSGTPLFREPKQNSSIVTTITDNKFYETLVRKQQPPETIEGVTDNWYLIEDAFGERGWVFGDSSFEKNTDVPYYLE